MLFELSEISKTDGYSEHDEKWIKVLKEPDGLISALATTEKAFKEVYKHNPKDNFIDEWRFVTKLSEGIVEKHSWILFSRTDKEKTDKQGLIEATAPSIKDKKNVFVKAGKNWVIKYKGKPTTLPDFEKIRYIVYLLERPRVPINVVDLLRAVKKINISEEIKKQSDTMKSAMSEWENLSEVKLNEKGVSLTDLAIDGLTYKEKEKFEDEGHKIHERLIDAKKKNNQQKIDRAQKELEGYKNHLFNEYDIKTHVSTKGIGFSKSHRPGPDIEKARKNVTNQINNAIKDIEKEIPPLAQHLSKHIETGKDCIYRPDDTNVIDWHIIW
jgi:hypothetical protein